MVDNLWTTVGQLRSDCGPSPDSRWTPSPTAHRVRRAVHRRPPNGWPPSTG